MSIERTVKAIFNLTPEDVAREFCEMDADEQAVFFNKVYFNSEKWKHSLSMQLQYVSESENLMDGGRSVMRLMGEYGRSHKNT